MCDILRYDKLDDVLLGEGTCCWSIGAPNASEGILCMQHGPTCIALCAIRFIWQIVASNPTQMQPLYVIMYELPIPRIVSAAQSDVLKWVPISCITMLLLQSDVLKCFFVVNIEVIDSGCLDFVPQNLSRKFLFTFVSCEMILHMN